MNYRVPLGTEKLPEQTARQELREETEYNVPGWNGWDLEPRIGRLANKTYRCFVGNVVTNKVLRLRVF